MRPCESVASRLSSALLATALVGCAPPDRPLPDAPAPPDAADAALDVVAPQDAAPRPDAAPPDAPADDRPEPPRLLVENLADPEIYRERDDLYLLSGTGSTRDLPIYESSDLELFHLRRVYNPSAVDPTHDYCHLWAPDLSKHEGRYYFFFSAHRVADGAPCPPPESANQEETTFFAVAPDLGLEFGPPQTLHEGTRLPRTQVRRGCPPEGCNRVIRIDAAVFGEGAARRLFYVWFFPGNNISSFPFADPGAVLDHAGGGPFASVEQPDEQDVNEAPEVIARDGRYYLFYSAGWFTERYAMYYVMGDSVTDLTRARATRRLSRPLVRADGRIAANAGHNAVTSRGGEYYNFFHVGRFDAEGRLAGRDTYRQRLSFRPDGSLRSANEVNLRWTRLPGRSYSLDVRRSDGTWIGPCVGAGVLGASAATVFTGLCPSAANQLIHKAEVTGFRLYHSADGTWREFVEVSYDGESDDVFFDLPGGVPAFVSLSWNELTTGTEYSLDVQRPDGAWVAPCVGDGVLGHRIAHDFDGRCTTAGVTVAPADVRRFRICSARGDDWARARCGEAAYDGRAMRLELTIP